MFYISWLEAHHSADDLQSSAGEENRDDCPDADRAAQHPSCEQNNGNDDCLDYADGGAGEAFADGDGQGIAGAAALPGGHIKILPIAHDEQPCNDHKDAEGQAFADGNRIKIADPIHIVAHQKSIQNGTETDLFLHQKIDTQDDDAADHMDDTEADADQGGNGHGKTFPGGNADICLYGQINPAGIEK